MQGKESFMMCVTGVANGYGPEGDAFVFGRRMRVLHEGGTHVIDEEPPSCCVRVADVPRRAYLRLRDGVDEEQGAEAVDAMRAKLGLSYAKTKLTCGWNNVFGDTAVRGYGSVRCMKAFTPRRPNAIPAAVPALGPLAEAAFAAVLCAGEASAAEELAVARHLRTSHLALVEDAVPCDAPAQRRSTARFEYKVPTIKHVSGILDAEASAFTAWNALGGWTLDAVCLDVELSRDGGTAVLVGVDFLRSTFRSDADDQAWVGPRLGRPKPSLSARADAGGLALVHEEIEAFDPDVVVFRSAAHRRALQKASEETGIVALGFVCGLKPTSDVLHERAWGRRGVCLLSDWTSAAPAARPHGHSSDDADDADADAETEVAVAVVSSSSAGAMSAAFCECRALWSALALARAARSTLHEALSARIPKLSDCCMLAELRARRILCPDWTHAAGPRRHKPRYKGGLVLEPKRGLYARPVHMMDYRGLYPSLVMEHGICFTARRSCRGDEALCGAAEGESRVLPALMKRLTAERAALQALATSPLATVAVGDPTPAIVKLATFVKLLMNAIIGKFGQEGARFDCVEIAQEITEAGRRSLQDAEAAAAAQGMAVIFGITDSVFVDAPAGCTAVAEARAAADKLATDLNSRRTHIHMRVERHTEHLLVVSKTQYACTDDSGAEVRAKGLELVKSDYPPATAACCAPALQALLVLGLGADAALRAAVEAFAGVKDALAPWVFLRTHKKAKKSKPIARDGDKQVADAVAEARKLGIRIEAGDDIPLVFVERGQQHALAVEGVAVAGKARPHAAYCAKRFVVRPLAKILAAAAAAGPLPDWERTVSAALGFALPVPRPHPAAGRGDGDEDPIEDPYDLALAADVPTMTVPCPDCGRGIAVKLTRETLRCGAPCPDCIVLLENLQERAAALLSSLSVADGRAVRTALLQAEYPQVIPLARVTLPFFGMK